MKMIWKVIKYIFYFYLACLAIFIIGCVYEIVEDKITTHKYQKTSQNYQEACKELDFETAREYLNELHQNYISEQSDYWSENLDETEGKFYEAFDYIYKAEIQYILSEFDEDECVDKISFLMDEIPIEGQKVPAGMVDKSIVGRPLNAYITWTEHYNRLCNTVLTLSINRNYPKLAKFALMQFVDNVEAHKGDSDSNVKIDGVRVDGDHGYIKYTSTDRDAAKKKYNEAVKMGLAK